MVINSAPFLSDFLHVREPLQPLAKSLGIVSVPTFKIFKDLEQVDEIRGAKYDMLLEKIAHHS